MENKKGHEGKEKTIIVTVDGKPVAFMKHEATGSQIKEAAGLPPDTELAVRREGKLYRITNDEVLIIKEGERFTVIHKEVSIHIFVEITKDDHRKLDFFDDRVTGREIKEAADVPLNYDLETKKEGKREIVKNDETITITEGEHFVVVEKEITIIVNGREKIFTEKEISFKQVVELAFGSSASNGNIMYTVAYTHGPEKNPKGTMVDGDKVHVKSGMIFNVTPTNKS